MPKQYSIKQQLIMTLGEYLGPMLIRLIGLLCRYRVDGEEHLVNAHKEGGVIMAMWHGRMNLPLYHLRNRKITALVSRSWDGEVITRIIKRLGYLTRRGSPREGGREGFIEMLRDLRNGKLVAIFPDGPTGPRHSLHDGVVHLARLSGCPIVPFSFAAKPAWRLKSWDKHMIPKPFSRGLIMFHEPFTLPRKIESDQMDKYRKLVIQRIIAVEQEVDLRMKVEVNSEA